MMDILSMQLAPLPVTPVGPPVPDRKRNKEEQLQFSMYNVYDTVSIVTLVLTLNRTIREFRNCPESGETNKNDAESHALPIICHAYLKTQLQIKL